MIQFCHFEVVYSLADDEAAAAAAVSCLQESKIVPHFDPLDEDFLLIFYEREWMLHPFLSFEE